MAQATETEIEAFVADVQEHIKELRRGDVATRRKAAVWLGEAGEPSAISALRDAYLGDDDPQVRDAAAYSLGMFRALQRGLEGENSDAIFERLEEIAVTRNFGRRLRFSVRAMSRVLVGLLTSLVILLVFTLVLWPSVLLPQLTADSASPANTVPTPEAPVDVPPAEEPAPTTAPAAEEPTAVPADPLSQAIAELDVLLAAITGDDGVHTRISGYWQAAADGDTTGCDAPAPDFPAAYTVPADVTDERLTLAVNLYNAGLTLTRQSWDQYTQGCAGGDLAAALEAGTGSAINAGVAFENARNALDDLR